MTPSAAATPIFIICRDRLAPLRKLEDWLVRHDHERLVLVDNASTYPPLLDYLEQSPHEVVRLTENQGPHRAIWGGDLLDRFAAGVPYVVTDCDVVPDEACPGDAIEYFAWALCRYPTYEKAGFSLRIDDLPDHYRPAQTVRDWERKFWERRLQPGLFHAGIDTTLALYRPDSEFVLDPAIRTGPPYVARHLPWYADSKRPSDEEQYYITHAKTDVTSWSFDDAHDYTRTVAPPRTPEQLKAWRRYARRQVERSTAVPRRFPRRGGHFLSSLDTARR